MNLFGIDAQNFSLSSLWCDSVSDYTDFEVICFDNEYKCGPNFIWNAASHKCEYSDCNQDIEC